MAKGNPRDSGYERAANDWYVESPESVHALLSAELFPGPIWDPAAGGGNIPQVCRQHGYATVATDLVDRGCPDLLVRDFLKFQAPPGVPEPAASIVSNPPFSLAADFVLHGLTLVPKVAVLQRTSWLEGQERHKRLFSRGWLSCMWQFSSRVSMPPGGSDSPARNGSVAFAWFVFQRDHSGRFEGGWLP